jgi:hypothetical protein
MIFVTVHPDMVAAPVLETIGLAAALGDAPHATLQAVASAISGEEAAFPAVSLRPREALLWKRDGERQPIRFQVAPSRTERRRHRRKYAVGELPPERSFFFRGAHGKLNLRAQNLMLFLQIADGVDDETWLHHLRAHDYSRWLRDFIKDPDMAQEVEAIEDARDLAPDASRKRVREAVETRYTVPAASAAA